MWSRVLQKGSSVWSVKLSQKKKKLSKFRNLPPGCGSDWVLSLPQVLQKLLHTLSNQTTLLAVCSHHQTNISIINISEASHWYQHCFGWRESINKVVTMLRGLQQQGPVVREKQCEVRKLRYGEQLWPPSGKRRHFHQWVRWDDPSDWCLYWRTVCSCKRTLQCWRQDWHTEHSCSPRTHAQTYSRLT